MLFVRRDDRVLVHELVEHALPFTEQASPLDRTGFPHVNGGGGLFMHSASRCALPGVAREQAPVPRPRGVGAESPPPPPPRRRRLPAGDIILKQIYLETRINYPLDRIFAGTYYGRVPIIRGCR